MEIFLVVAKSCMWYEKLFMQIGILFTEFGCVLVPVHKYEKFSLKYRNKETFSVLKLFDFTIAN